MKTRPVDPLCLDVVAFAKQGESLAGEWPLASLERLCGAMHPEASAADAPPATWQANGESRELRAGEAQVWLHLHAQARLPLVCQRCLAAVEANLDMHRSFLFVQGEDAAAELDADSEDDVLALTRALDLRELIEDELLLALPLVPRHEVCPEPLPMERDETSDEAPASPFAALAALKRGGLAN